MGKSAAPPPLIFQYPPPAPTNPSNLQSPSFNLDSKISPSVLLIIIILAIIFFVSGLLHLLVRCLLRPVRRVDDRYSPDGLLESVTALQGQLQQLFHLHDAGVDQSYIDTLPVFPYSAIIGVKDPFDCAVCLCEFEPEDKLRLLPKCSHAFHMDCIDTWLLSHSTCPLCRSSLLAEFNSYGGNGTAIVCVLESGDGDTPRESVSESNSHSHNLGMELGLSGRKSTEFRGDPEERIVSVKLGKFRNVDGGEGSSNEENNNNQGMGMGNGNGNGELGSRRCYSMGSFAYVLDEKTSLQVPIRTPMKKQSSNKKPCLPLKPGHRAAMSEYGCDSRREFNGIEAFKSIEKLQGNGNGESGSKREGFSISKIWARGGGGGGGERNRKGNDTSSRRTISEIEIDVSELGGDEETQSCYSVDSLANPNMSSSSTSHKRTLLWLMGRQNKLVHNHSSFSSSSNV